MAHAELSPSSAARWMTCPGSVALCRGIEDTSSGYADEGTDAHELAAMCLERGQNAAGFIGTTLGMGNVVDQDMAWYVQQYVDLIHDLAAGHPGIILVEQKLSIAHITGEADATGTSDAVILHDTELVVADLKYGRGVQVDAQDNPQLRIYALAALKQFGMVQDFQTVRMVIVQPRLGHVSEAVMTVEALEAFGIAVMEAAAATQLPNAALRPAEKACQFCKAKANCPALRNEVLDQFDALPVGDIPLAQDDGLGDCMSRIDLIEGWCKAIRAEVERRLLAGKPVRGYKLVQGKRGNRQWTSKEEAEALLKAMRVPHDRMFDYSVISPTSADKLAKEGVIGPRQWPKVQALITQAEGKPSVAPESDKRPALITDVSGDFADLTVSTTDL